MENRMRTLLAASGLLGAGMSVYRYFLLPELVPVHFRAGGSPDSWMSNETASAVSLCIHAGITLLFLFLPNLLYRMPIALVNFPKKEYWLDPARRQENMPVVASWLSVPGIILNILFFIVDIIAWPVQSGQATRLNEGPFLIATGAGASGIIFWIVLLHLRFRKTNQ